MNRKKKTQICSRIQQDDRLHCCVWDECDNTLLFSEATIPNDGVTNTVRLEIQYGKGQVYQRYDIDRRALPTLAKFLGILAKKARPL